MSAGSPVAEQAATVFRERIFGYIRGKNVPESDWDDVYGDILLKAAQQARRYDSAKASPSTWVYLISRSAVADYFRRRKIELPLTVEIADDFDIESRVDYEAELRELARQLTRLREQERQALALRFYKGLNYREIAARMGLTEANARKHCSRAISKLKTLMEVLS
jgi:RNA polymerase sigma-70 factor (ECF subfamily)